jgi:hypothetical protein
MDITTRNRAIKKTLEQAFGRGKIRVRGSRGTAYGWVHVHIDYTPLDSDKAQEMRGLCTQLLRAAKIDLGRSYTDDTCQFESDQCNISFNPTRYYRTHRHSDGTLSALVDYHTSEWTTVEEANTDWNGESARQRIGGTVGS